ncbi:Kazal-type serine protease inhibitor domain-containing protein [Flavilitoribacter nigricans]|uniref:T9SS type A sorting domain-containing protein n=1 Tax=Flavilitoribacter nigricans (strain ATCC 23147 / DSM 23189 / NBRC 102662 / NCIMB 1420 / SS-2) TaxID=1122177 RepID=A0A2D0NGA0_FLAN2|nr:Kazal-type serine protease inhibitor domain-containing protein [Flavilitoribacter nigricans]PHN07410.1 hypothetical protein CRP01_07210 [Flavilitoribacter nigricans DSM 23189 = NBRC 102662]
MRKTSTLLCFFLTGIFLFSVSTISAQLFLWPGDINDNGIVNGKDVLRWGYANGATGPGRLDDGSVWTFLNLSLPWSENFPGETNFSYGDCDGSGLIDLEDVRGPITNHFGLTHGIVQPDYCPVGDEENSPQLQFIADKETYGTGARIELEVWLGTEDIPAVDFYGITFQLKYNRDIIRPGAVTYTPNDGGWYDPANASSYSFFHNEVSSGTVEIAVTRTNQEGVDGHGLLGHISLILRGNIDITLPGALNLEVDLVQMINSEMEIIPVFYDPNVIIVISDDDQASSCPKVVDPVCGSDGKTYINSCYAEAAGITEYTQGVCYSDCIDPGIMRPDSECETTTIDPVCGCNNITYSNPCLAEAAGVTSYTSGPCATGPDDRSCYDPILVVQSSGTSVNENTGEITVDCPAEIDPVCGCNGITYDNACMAEASGIAFYTPGVCDEICIDPEVMEPDPICEYEYEPVCGCNGITYTNACIAEASGVIDYTPGPCGQSSDWCEEATPIQCGDFLAQETTVGYGNQITNYPNCLPQSFLGPDRVYVFDKKTAGDLQIGLEILTPNIDLDLFLLKGTCDEVVCLGASTTNNKKSNNEGIVLEDAPLGTYYIVVDAQFADVEGRFRLEVNCGYLYCGDAFELDCGTPFKYNNSLGEDDVSLYTCGPNVYNVENNGPEVVHYFTTTTAGNVDIQLSGLSANLELFLLRDCDRGECMQYSQNPGTSNEIISTYLEPGTYYVVVDGYNGATSDYTLQVDCENTCELEFTSITTTPSNCATNTGTIEITSSGGTPSYIVYYSGPVSGSFSTSSNTCAIYYLPSGTYQIRKIDAKGCEVEETVTINSTGTLNAQVVPYNAICDEPGGLSVTMQGGEAPYRVFLSGPENAELLYNTPNFVINELDPGAYDLYILDARGCSVSKKATVQEAQSNFTFSVTPFPAGCGELGYIQVMTQNGSGPYSIQIAGPVSGNAQEQSSAFKVTKLPGGTYSITVQDANGCSHTSNFTIGDINLEVTTSVMNGICGRPGEILVQITNGTGDYLISWSGAANGSITTSSENYLIQNLPSGDYQIDVEDANQCTGFDVAEVNNTGENLSTTVQPNDGTCGQNGSLSITINNGMVPYTINWSGPVSGQTQINAKSYTIPNLPDGLYELIISDNNNCQDEESAFVNIAPALNVDLTGLNGDCGQDGAIRVNMTTGQANYIISWTGPTSGSANSSEKEYDITGLASGTYQVSVTDARGCTDSGSMTIENAEGVLGINATPQTATCDQPGSISINVTDGAAPYQISWEGPDSGADETNADGDLLISDLLAGTYQISATDQNGCTGTATVVVEADSGNVGISLSAQDPICTTPGRINVSITNGSPDYSVSWEGPVNGVSSTGASEFAIVDLPAGTYKVTVADQFGCEAVDNITLTATGELSLIANAANAACGFGQIQLAISDGTPAFEISWEGPINGSITTNNANYVIPNLPDGTYDVSVTDLNGCNDAMEVTIFSGSQPGITASPQPGSCGENGSIGISITGGAPDFTVQWNGPSNGSRVLSNNFFNIPDLPSGTYNIQLTDDNGCTDLTTIELINGTTDLGVTTGLNENECGQQNIIEVIISGGVADFVIDWTGPQNGTRNSSNSSLTIPELPPGDYQITITDANGCTVEDAINVPVTPIELLSLSAQPGICGQLGAIEVQITDGSPDYTVNWEGPISGITTSSEQTVIIDALPSGSYTVVVTDANGCSETEIIELNNDQSDLEMTLELAPNECGQLHHIQVNISGGAAAYTVDWTGPENGSEASPTDVLIIEELPEGTYEVVVTDQNGCMATASIAVTEEPLDVLRLRAEPGTCGELGQIRVTMNGGVPDFAISWSGPANGSVTTGDQEYFITDLPPGEYEVTTVDNNGCTASRTVNLQSSTALEATVSGTNETCTDPAFITISIAAGSPGYSISWTGPQAANGSVTTTNASYQIADLIPGNYEVTIIDARGCQHTESVTLEANNNNLEIEAIGENGLCGANGSITVNVLEGSPEFAITWTGPVSGSDATTASSFNINDLPSGTYQLSVTDQNGCTQSAEVTIENQSELNISLTGTDGSCGQNGAIRVVMTEGAADYAIRWSGPENGSANTSEATYDIADLPAGAYQVSVTDARGCTAEDNVTIVSTGGMLVISATSQNAICEEPGAIQIDVNGGMGAYQVSWEGPVSGAGETDADGNLNIPDLTAGTYQISAIDQNGCSGTITTIIAGESGDLAVTLRGLDPICDQAGRINVSINNGRPNYMVRWQGPVNGVSNTGVKEFAITDLPAGNYLISVTDDFGCVVEENIVLTDTGKLDFSATPSNVACGSGQIELAISQGTSGFDISWQGPVNGSATTNNTNYMIPDLPDGTYTVMVTDANGCSSTREVEVITTQGELDILLELATNQCGQLHNIRVNISGGEAGYTVRWNGPETGTGATPVNRFTIEDLDEGDYTISVTDQNGCMAIGTIEVVEQPLNILRLRADAGTCGAMGQIRVTINGGEPGYDLSWTGPVNGSASTNEQEYFITDLPPGNYVVRMEDINNCVVSRSVELQPSSAPLEATVTGGDATCNAPAFISVNISAGSPGYSISWAGPPPLNGTVNTSNTSYRINGLIAGSYEVTVIDGRGCEYKETVNLQGNDGNLQIETSGQDGLCGTDGAITVDITAGAPDYAIEWDGPVSGSANTSESSFTIDELPGGTYALTVSDQNGCVKNAQVEIVNTSEIDAAITGIQGGCGKLGRIDVDYNGQPPFTLDWTGPRSGSQVVNGNNYNIANLITGTYEVKITDSKGCSFTRMVDIENTANNVIVNLTTQTGACDQPGAIQVAINGGQPGYTIEWNSVNAQGSATTADNYLIADLPGGLYTIDVTDATGCTTQEQVQLVTHINTVSLSSSVVNPSCDTKGSITLNIDGDFPNFTIQWSGASTGSAVAGRGNYTIPDLEEGDYTIVVSDVNGCSRSTTASLNNVSGSPDAFFNHTEDNLTVTFDHSASTGAYAWDFGDGESSTEADPVHEFCDPGTYQVCLTVTNGCGADEYCTNITVSIPDDVVLLNVGERVGSVGGSVQVPVTVNNLEQLISLEGSIALENNGVAQITGLSPGVISPQYISQSQSFTFYQNDQEGVTLLDGDILFYIDLQISGAPGTRTFIRLVNDPMSLEVGSIDNGLAVTVPHFTLKGSVTVAEFGSIAGKVSTYWGAPIPNSEIALTGPDINTTTNTDASGNYRLPDLDLNQSYTVRAGKNNFPFNGLSTYALFIGQRFILGMEPEQVSSPYQIIAGDANCNGSFTTLDLFIIQQLIVGATDDFNYCPSWVFISEDNPMPTDFDAYNVFPYLDEKTLNLQGDSIANFVGVKVGDILGQANPEALKSEPEIEIRNPVYLDLLAENQSIRAGESLELRVTSAGFADIVSYQFSLDFDQQALRFSGFEKAALSDLASAVAGTQLAEKGQLAISWFSQRGMGVDAKTDDALFTIRFEALRDIADLRELFAVKELPVRAEAHNQNGERYKIRLDWTGEEVIPEVSDFRLYQNVPNPARKQTRIRFDLPQAYSGELILHDNFGRIIDRRAGDFAAGTNYLTLPLDPLQGGVFYYTLKAGPHTATRSMIVVK